MIAFVVNGQKVQVSAAADVPLLDVLRNELGLKGPRFGCGLEQCGTCMVLLDGEPVYACSREVGSIAGRHIHTVESLRDHRRAGRPMRLLPVRYSDQRQGVAGSQSDTEPGRYRCRVGQASLPLRHPSSYLARRRAGSGNAGGSAGMNTSLPLSITNNRRLDKWVRFGPDRRVRLAVGKVEIGQGVLTALSQIAAEELDVGFGRISILAGDTEAAPDEGSTSSSQSIEMSGSSVRLLMAEVRARVLDRLARRLNCSPEDLRVEDGEL